MPISSALGSSALLPAGLGFRNKIINGDFGINQRGTLTTTSGGTFVFDRWMQWAADGTSTFSSESFAVGNVISGQEPIKYAQIITSGQSAVGAQSNLQQRVEDVRTCAGQQVVVSFWAKAASGTPKIAVEIEQNFGSGGSSVVNYYGGFATISTTWARYSVSLIVPSVASKTIGTSSFMALNLWVSSGSTNGFRNGSMGIQNNTFQFWGVQLEQNYQPTPFEQRPIGTELVLCQRYYQQKRYENESYDFVFNIGIAWPSSKYKFIGQPFSVEMRVAPTMTLESGAGAGFDGKARYITSNVNAAGVDLGVYSLVPRKTGFMIKSYNEADAYTHYGIACGYKAEAEL